MNESVYEESVRREVRIWQRQMVQSPTWANRLAKRVQQKINNIIPEKIHQAITATIKQMIRAVLFGAKFTAPESVINLSLEQREALIRDRMAFYKNTAAAEGGITGAGGILLSFADFPLLLGIKLKMLHDIAALYGHSVTDYKERIYLLYIFQLAFSSQEQRTHIYRQIVNWEEQKKHLPDDIHQFDWRTFQQEYRDYIDLAKLAQFIPVIGAPVGAVVNYRLLDKLGRTAMNAYRMRWLTKSRIT